MYQRKEHVDHMPGTSNFHGSLQFKLNGKKLWSSNLVYSRKIPFIAHIAVARLRAFIIEYHLQFYIFHREGSGCLYWQLYVPHWDHGNGWLDPGGDLGRGQSWY